ncbi:MAG TPA: hypothetical protein VFV58_11995 [Blastocatellia bacterium]|nr:hypothetical protein [Blastocatellia bacterium]
MNTTEFNTDDPRIYRATAKMWEAISDPATPEAIRMAMTEEIAFEISRIIPLLDFSNRAVVTQLYPLVLELGQTALFDPDGPTVRDVNVIPIRIAA